MHVSDLLEVGCWTTGSSEWGDDYDWRDGALIPWVGWCAWAVTRLFAVVKITSIFECSGHVPQMLSTKLAKLEKRNVLTFWGSHNLAVVDVCHLLTG